MNIKEARLQAGLTQKKMSEILGIPTRTIQDWEAGKRTPPDWVKNLVINELKRLINDESPEQS